MLPENYFIKKPEFYKRDFDHIKSYVDQMSFYISKMKDIDYKEANILVRQTLNDKNKVQIKNPIVQFMERGENKDNYLTSCRLRSYLDHIRDSKVIVAPTFTVYLNPEVEESPLKSFTVHNTKRRSQAKKLAYAHKAKGETDLFVSEWLNQGAYKTLNNSSSGAYSSDGTVVHNPSGHSTLTSVTRSQTSLMNSSNEKLISGNRYYKSPDMALNNAIYLSRICDNKNIRTLINRYDLHVPTVPDMVDCFIRSTDNYFSYGKSYENIIAYFEKLTEEERCAIVYTSDLFHLRKHNPHLVRNLLGALSERKAINDTGIDSLELLKSADEQVLNFVHIICQEQLKGLDKDYNVIPKEVVDTIAGTAFNVYSVLTRFRDLIEGFFVTEAMPCSSAYMDLMTRQTVVVSDTDSSMAAIDEFVMWYYGDLIFTPESMALAASVMFISTQTILGILAQFFTNMGVGKDLIFLPGMKPEYTFPVFLQTPVSKHYGTFKTIQEGLVFKKPEMEIKGVHLRNSAFSSRVTESSDEMLKRILFKVYNNEKLSLFEFLKYVADFEREIESTIKSGSIEFYKKTKIREKTAYAKDEINSPYREYTLWKDVFEEKYGVTEPPEYEAIKIPVPFDTKAKLKNWITGIDDDAVKAGLFNYFSVHKRDTLNRFYMPTTLALTNGIPDIIVSAVDIKSIILDVTVAHRLYLQSIGFCPKLDTTICEHGY